MKIIINLLPQDHKQALKFKRKCNVVLKLSATASVAVLVYVLFVISCTQILEMEKRTINQEIQRTEASKSFRTIRADQELIKDNYNMAGIIERGFSHKKSFLPVFDTVNATAPEGIILEEIKVGAQTVMIKGVGNDRQDVIDFKNRLEQEPLFSKVESPISNFTQQKDVLFEFNIAFKDAKKSDGK